MDRAVDDTGALRRVLRWNKKAMLDPWNWAGIALFLVAYGIGPNFGWTYSTGVLVGAITGLVILQLPRRDYIATNTEE